VSLTSTNQVVMIGIIECEVTLFSWVGVVSEAVLFLTLLTEIRNTERFRFIDKLPGFFVLGISVNVGAHMRCGGERLLTWTIAW